MAVFEMNQHQRELVRQSQSPYSLAFLILGVLITLICAVGYLYSADGMLKNLCAFYFIFYVIMNWWAFAKTLIIAIGGWANLKLRKNNEPFIPHQEMWNAILTFAPAQRKTWTASLALDFLLDVFVFAFLIHIGFIVSACFHLIFIASLFGRSKLKRMAIEYLRNYIEPPEQEETIDELCEKLFHGE